MDKNSQIEYMKFLQNKNLFFFNLLKFEENKVNVFYYNLEFNSSNNKRKKEILSSIIDKEVSIENENIFFENNGIRYIFNNISRFKIGKEIFSNSSLYTYYDKEEEIDSIQSTALIGFNSNVKKLYYGKIKHNQLLIVEALRKKENIMSFIDSNLALAKKDYYFISPENMTLDNHEAIFLLDNHVEESRVRKAIISIDSRTRMQYLIYFSLKKIDILADEPIITIKDHISSYESNYKIINFYNILASYYKLQNKNFSITIQSQRRFHNGYIFVMNAISKILEETKLKISDIYIEYNDEKIEDQKDDNSLHKNDFGKLMNGGYHLVDLITHISKLNGDYEFIKIDSISRGVSDYSNFFKDFKLNVFSFDKLRKTSQEEDIYANVIFKNNLIKTVGRLCIQSMGSSIRYKLNENEFIEYGNNEILKSERVVVKIGNILSIHISNFKLKETEQGSRNEDSRGESDYFDVNIYKNNDILSSDINSLGTFNFQDFFNKNNNHIDVNHNEIANLKMIDEFYSNKKSEHSDLLNHELSILIFASIYNSIIKYNEEDFKNAQSIIIKEINDKFNKPIFQGSFLQYITNDVFRKINDVDVVISVDDKNIYRILTSLPFVRKVSSSPTNNRIWYVVFVIDGIEYKYDFLNYEESIKNLFSTKIYHIGKTKFLGSDPINVFVSNIDKINNLYCKKGLIRGRDLFDLNSSIEKIDWNDSDLLDKLSKNFNRLKKSSETIGKIPYINKLSENISNNIDKKDFMITLLNKYFIKIGVIQKNNLNFLFSKISKILESLKYL